MSEKETERLKEIETDRERERETERDKNKEREDRMAYYLIYNQQQKENYSTQHTSFLLYSTMVVAPVKAFL